MQQLLRIAPQEPRRFRQPRLGRPLRKLNVQVLAPRKRLPMSLPRRRTLLSRKEISLILLHLLLMKNLEELLANEGGRRD